MSDYDRVCRGRLFSAPTLDLAGIAAAVIPLIPPIVGGQLVPQLTAFVSPLWNEPNPPAPFFTDVLLAQAWLLTQGVGPTTPGAIIIYPGVYGTVTPGNVAGKRNELSGEDARQYGVALRAHLIQKSSSRYGKCTSRKSARSARAIAYKGEFVFKGERIISANATYDPFPVNPNVHIRAAVTGTVVLNYDITITEPSDGSDNANIFSDLIIFSNNLSVVLPNQSPTSGNPVIVQFINCDINAASSITVSGGTSGKTIATPEAHFRNTNLVAQTLAFSDGGLITITGASHVIVTSSTNICTAPTTEVNYLDVYFEQIVDCELGELLLSYTFATQLAFLTVTDCGLRTASVANTDTGVLAIYDSRFDCVGTCVVDQLSKMMLDGSASNIYDMLNVDDNASFAVAGSILTFFAGCGIGLNSSGENPGGIFKANNAEVVLFNTPETNTSFDCAGSATIASFNNCQLTALAINSTNGANVYLSNTALDPHITLYADGTSTISRSAFAASAILTGPNAPGYNSNFAVINFPTPFGPDVDVSTIHVTATWTKLAENFNFSDQVVTMVINAPATNAQSFQIGVNTAVNGPFTNFAIDYQVRCDLPIH